MNVHQYREKDSVISIRKINDLHLADLQLKSRHDFHAAYNVALSAGLGDYMRKFVVIQAGGWFCQFNCTQIIYGCLKKFTRHNPDQGDIPTDSNMVVSHNHSYSFPSTTASTVNCFNHNMKSQPALLSIVPTIGPLHISLNSKEHVVS